MAAANAAPAPRARSRALNLTPAPVVQPVANPGQPESAATSEMVKLAQNALKANALKNAATKTEKDTAEALNKLMIDKGVKQFAFTVELGGAFVNAEAKISGGTKDVIDVALLKTLVDEATFMKIVNATKGAIETHAGKNMVVKVTKTEDTPEALKIAKVKA
jgi:hypothetical protein